MNDFFFSSRRRHTRYWRDWSSDVCSSDLSKVRKLFEQAKQAGKAIIFIDEIDAIGKRRGSGYTGGHQEQEQTLNQILTEMRSEERRVGKECRSRWSPYH